MMKRFITQKGSFCRLSRPVPPVEQKPLSNRYASENSRNQSKSINVISDNCWPAKTIHVGPILGRNIMGAKVLITALFGPPIFRNFGLYFGGEISETFLRTDVYLRQSRHRVLCAQWFLGRFPRNPHSIAEILGGLGVWCVNKSELTMLDRRGGSKDCESYQHYSEPHRLK